MFKLISWAMLSALLAVTGCSVQQNGTDDNENVKIKTPLGGMKVKTNDAVVVADIGLPSYPGATLVKQDKDNGAADVEMNFGDFHLRVKAVSYHTSDSPEKVIAFYRKGLSSYGDVIECKGKQAVGKPSQTKDGLTCDENANHVMESGSDIELKAGAKLHQHVVAIEKQSDGTKFGLVVLDLPKGEKSESN